MNDFIYWDEQWNGFIPNDKNKLEDLESLVNNAGISDLLKKKLDDSKHTRNI